MNDTLRVGTLFSGIGAPETALNIFDMKYNFEWFCEIDKYAVVSYGAIHSKHKAKNQGDITKINISKLSKVDLIFHGSPCQDFSIAGNGAGGNAGSKTRSSLMWNSVEIIKHIKPKYVIWENVKGVLSKTHKHNFDKYLKALNELGYENYYKVLNSKDYSIPQDRDRVFVVSILSKNRTITSFSDIIQFEFPKIEPLNKCLLDIMEPEVDEKYFLSDKILKSFFEHNKDGKYLFKPKNATDISGTITASYYKTSPTDTAILISNINPSGTVHSPNGIAPTITTNKGEGRKVLIRVDNNPKASQGYRVFDPSGVATTQVGTAGGLGGKTGLYLVKKKIKYAGHLDIPGWHNKAKEVLDPKGISNCIHTQSNNLLQKVFVPTEIKAVEKNNRLVIYDELGNTYRIRRLTPLETWRLMGQSDENFYKAKKALNKAFYKGKDRSNSQLYKQAGNSIVVNVLVAIFKELFKE